ncbi:MAG: MOSC domain-containing protein [Candidatus Eisenbacteria bacterium]|nr:MOSC domain-containing protein [Candidatus Eisenbacteria bacterium]
MAIQARLTSINAGSLRELAIGDRTVQTGLFKTPLQGSTIVGVEGVEGDRIGSPKHHGGPDQAVYLYSEEDIEFWRGQLAVECGPGFFGENLTLDRWWPDLRIGDRLVAGDVTLEITAPRIPCATLAARTGDPKFVRRFVEAARPGAYARVLMPGTLSPGDLFEVVLAPESHPTIGALFALWHSDRSDLALIRSALASPIGSRARGAFESWLQAAEGR